MLPSKLTWQEAPFRGVADAVERMVVDSFKKSRELATELQHRGLAAEGQTLLDAIDGGSTGTEIQMAVRFHLRRISADDRIDTSLRELSRQLAVEITRVLGT